MCSLKHPAVSSLRLVIRAVRRYSTPDHRDRMQDGKGPAKGDNPEANVEHEHDQRSRHSAVQHAKRSEKECEYQGQQDAFTVPHVDTIRQTEFRLTDKVAGSAVYKLNSEVWTPRSGVWES